MTDAEQRLEAAVADYIQENADPGQTFFVSGFNLIAAAQDVSEGGGETFYFGYSPDRQPFYVTLGLATYSAARLHEKCRDDHD